MSHKEMQIVPKEPTAAMLRPFLKCPPEELPLAWAAMLIVSNVHNQLGGSDRYSRPMLRHPRGVPVTLNEMEQRYLIGWLLDQYETLPSHIKSLLENVALRQGLVTQGFTVAVGDRSGPIDTD